MPHSPSRKGLPRPPGASTGFSCIYYISCCSAGWSLSVCYVQIVDVFDQLFVSSLAQEAGLLAPQLNLLHSPLLFWPNSNLADSISPGPWARSALLRVDYVVSRSHRGCQTIPLRKKKKKNTYSTASKVMYFPVLFMGHMRPLLPLGQLFMQFCVSCSCSEI